MNPRLRVILFSLCGAAIAVAVGADVADESYGLAGLIVLAAGWLIAKRASQAAPDAWLVSLILFGYIVGNRGFAQLQPAGRLPLLPAEAVLLAAVPALLFRMALKQSLGIRRDLLNFSILAWMIIGSVRLPLDMNRFGVMALRDFATVYYASFFFIAQDLGCRPGSMRLLLRTLSVSFILLLPVVVSTLIAPDYLIEHLTYRGIPLIYHKSDLIATSLAAGFFWLWTRWERGHKPVWILVAGASLLLIGAMASPRAGMFALGATTLLWLGTGRWRSVAAELGIVAAGLAASLLVVAFSGRDLKTSLPYSVYEHAVSIFDPTGTGTYVNGQSGDPGGNNRFRLIWWRDVVEDTLAKNPIMGLGFGSDLSTRFLADYDLLSDENFAARDPHSITTRERWDPWSPIAMAGLGAFGVAFIYSAQLPVQGRGWIAQMVWLLLGAGVYITVSLIDYQFWLGVAHWFYAISLVPLVLVLVPGIGSEVYGSQRWIRMGPVSFQPSELAIDRVLLITASLLMRSEIGTVRQSLGVLGKLALAVGVPMLLILLQPDLKSAIVLPPMVFSMLYVSRLSGRFFAGALAAFLLVTGLVAWDTWRYWISWRRTAIRSRRTGALRTAQLGAAARLPAQPHPVLRRPGQDRPHGDRLESAPVADLGRHPAA
jgi:hypothetical protein